MTEPAKQRLFDDTVRALSLALDVDADTKLFHAWRVALLAKQIAEELGLDDPSLVFYGGLLHDIGGMGLRDHVVHAAANDFADPQARAHAAEGARILKPLSVLSPVVDMVADHHERFDGHGFPLGRRGDEISRAAYVCHIADVLDLSLRAAKERATPGALAAVITQGNDASWPRVVGDAALAVLNRTPELVATLLDESALQRAIETMPLEARHLDEVEYADLMAQMLWVFARIVDLKHPYTMGHSVRVAKIAHAIACGLGDAEINVWDVTWASLLHDVGKIGVPRSLLDKTEDLTAEEREIVRGHAQGTVVIVSSIRELAYLAYPAAAHHEWYDGSGYPQGVAGEEIPLLGRIIAYADSYDAMRSARAHHPALSHDVAMRRIRENVGTQFDPHLAEVALPVLDSWGDALHLAETDDFRLFYDAAVPDLRQAIPRREANRVVARFSRQGALLVELETWQRLNVASDWTLGVGAAGLRKFASVPDADHLDQLIDAESNQRLRAWLADDGGDEQLATYLFTPAGRPMEVVAQRRGPELEILYRSAENRLQTMKRMALFYRNFLSSSEAAFFATPAGLVIDVNRTLLDLYGYQLRDLVGKPPPIFGNGPVQPLQDLLAAPHGHAPHAWDGELTTYHKDGTPIPTLVTLTVVRDASGSVMGVIGRVVDISMRKKLEAELSASNAQLRSLNQLKSDFVAITSHDLRAPLQGMIAYAQLLRDAQVELPPAKTAEYLERMVGLGERGLTLINDILNFERIESGTFELSPGPTRVDAILRDCVESMVPTAKARDVELAVAFAGEVHLVAADAARLAQVFSNLISNAIKFSPAGECIEVHCTDDGNAIRVSVSDRGPGIPEDELQLIFDRYRQASRGGTVSERGFGVGLGLHIARSIVTMHEGHVWAENRRGGGARMWVELPVPGCDLTGGAPVAIVHNAAQPRMHQVGAALTGAGVRTLGVRDAEDARRMCAVATPAIAFVDAGVDDVADLVVALRDGREPPLVVIVGESDGFGSQLNSDGMLSDPILDIEVLALLRDARIRRQQLESAS